MSKNSDKEEEWEQFTQYFIKHKLFSNTQALNWEAKNPDEIWQSTGKDMAASAVASGLKIFTAAKLSKTQLAGAVFAAGKGLVGGIK